MEEMVTTTTLPKSAFSKEFIGYRNSVKVGHESQSCWETKRRVIAASGVILFYKGLRRLPQCWTQHFDRYLRSFGRLLTGRHYVVKLGSEV